MEGGKSENPKKYERRMKQRRENARKRYNGIGLETGRRKRKEKREAMTEVELNVERVKQQQYRRTYVEKRKREGTYEMLLSQKRIYGAKQRQSEQYKMDKQCRDRDRRNNDPVWHEEWKAKIREHAAGRRKLFKQDPEKYQRQLEYERMAGRKCCERRKAAETLCSFQNDLLTACILNTMS